MNFSGSESFRRGREAWVFARATCRVAISARRPVNLHWTCVWRVGSILKGMLVKLVLKNRKNGGAGQTDRMGAWERYGTPPSQTDRGYWERCSTNQTNRQDIITDRQKVTGFVILISAAENIGALNNIIAGTE